MGKRIHKTHEDNNKSLLLSVLSQVHQPVKSLHG
jgi:hypothetical protein